MEKYTFYRYFPIFSYIPYMMMRTMMMMTMTMRMMEGPMGRGPFWPMGPLGPWPKGPGPPAGQGFSEDLRVRVCWPPTWHQLFLVFAPYLYMCIYIYI